MIDYLRDPVWQSIGVVIAAIAIYASYWIYTQQKTVREISFGLISSRDLLKVDSTFSPRIKIQFDGKAISNLHLNVYGLKNSGTTAIKPEEFIRPISLKFREEEVISANISSEFPKNLGAFLAFSNSSVEIRPLLLNPGDQIIFQVVFSSEQPEPAIDGRIVNVPEFEKINTTPQLPKFKESGLVYLLTISIAVTLFSLYYYPEEAFWKLWLGFGIYIVVYGLVTRVLERRRASFRRRVSEQ